MKSDLKKGDTVVAVKVNPLEGNTVAPPLEYGAEYTVKQVTTTAGNDHIDVGLKSRYNFISCYETGEHIPNGDTIHWCHPSRFVKR